jgi:hypothetical protein
MLHTGSIPLPIFDWSVAFAYCDNAGLRHPSQHDSLGVELEAVRETI